MLFEICWKGLRASGASSTLFLRGCLVSSSAMESGGSVAFPNPKTEPDFCFFGVTGNSLSRGRMNPSLRGLRGESGAVSMDSMEENPKVGIVSV